MPLKRDIDPHIMVMTQIEDNQVVIEVDATDSLLEEALETVGVSHSQIIVAK